MRGSGTAQAIAILEKISAYFASLLRECLQLPAGQQGEALRPFKKWTHPMIAGT